jgi:hypothetical protein
MGLIRQVDGPQQHLGHSVSRRREEALAETLAPSRQGDPPHARMSFHALNRRHICALGCMGLQGLVPASLLDDPIRLKKQGCGDRQVQVSRHSLVDNQLKLVRLLDGDVARDFTAKNSVDEPR